MEFNFSITFIKTPNTLIIVNYNIITLFFKVYILVFFQKGNILATFHNHFEGAIIPSSNDFNNSILPKLKFTVITSKNLIGIIINDNYELDSEIFLRLINDFKLFEVYINCFSNDE